MNVFKALRLEHKLSQEKLAQHLNVHQTAVSQWELGRSTPDVDILRKLSDFFGVSIDYLLGRTAFRNPTELFEHWDGHNNPFFESPFDFGGLLREVREAQGVSQQEASKALGITESDVDGIEEGVLPLNYEWAEKYAAFLGTSVTQVFVDGGMDASLKDIPLELLHHYQNLEMSENEMIKAYAKHRNPDLTPFLLSDKTYKIPVLGSIPAGVPVEAVQDVIGYEEISSEWIKGEREYFGLLVKGDSMYPEYLNGDVVIVRKQSTCDSGDDCVVLVNDAEATLKRVNILSESIELEAINPMHGKKKYTNEEIEKLPVTILGVVVELRRKKK